MINANQIKPHMPVVCSKGGQFGVVDHIEGENAIKLSKDKSGQHHYIPMSWVDSVDSKVHVDRPGEEAMKQWSTSPPTGPGGTSVNANAGDPTHTERVRSQQDGVQHPEKDPERASKMSGK